MMLRPTMEQDQVFAGLMGLLSGLTAAFAYMQVMALGKLGEPESRTVFYFAVGSAVAGGVGMAATGVSPWDWRQALWLLPIGVLAVAGPAVHDARLQPAAPPWWWPTCSTPGIVFGALYSVMLFGDPFR